MADDAFLSRWSRRKIDARAGRETGDVPEAPDATPKPVPVAGVTEPVVEPPPPGESLPAIESLTPESDFTPFMGREVKPGVQHQALRKLFADPQFNVMDGLDIYTGDYSQPDPLPAEWLGKMNQMARLGAWQEPVPEDAPEAVDQDEKIETEQVFVETPSGETSVTPDEAIVPPEVSQ